MPYRGQWILRGRTPVQASSMQEWAEFFENASNRIVSRTKLSSTIEVSTVFLGVDHSFGNEVQPVLFETMVFHDGDGREQEWCSTWDQAVAMHARVIQETCERYGLQRPDPTMIGGSTIPFPITKRVYFKDNRPTIWQHLLDDEDD